MVCGLDICQFIDPPYDVIDMPWISVPLLPYCTACKGHTHLLLPNNYVAHHHHAHHKTNLWIPGCNLRHPRMRPSLTILSPQDVNYIVDATFLNIHFIAPLFLISPNIFGLRNRPRP